MPVSSTGKNVEYTTDEEIGYLMESVEIDHCVDFIGFIQEIYGRIPAIVKGEKKELYKFIVSNGSKRLTVLIWDTEKIEQLSTEFQFEKIIHLDGCEGQVVPMRDNLVRAGVLNYEIRIQLDSIVEMNFGFHVHSTQRIGTAVPTIEFLDIPKASGKFKVQAYVKTVMVPARNNEGILGFGTGALTEGKHKIPIKLNAFKKGRLTLVCQDVNCLEVLADEMKLEEEQVNKANIPLKRCIQNVENLNPNAKKMMFEVSNEEKKVFEK